MWSATQASRVEKLKEDYRDLAKISIGQNILEIEQHNKILTN